MATDPLARRGTRAPTAARHAITNISCVGITRPSSATTRSLRWGLAIAVTTFVAVIHWLAAAHVLAGGWTAGIPHNTTGYVLTFLPVALLILPEVGSITVGGLKVEMRRTQEEVSKLGAQIHQLQIQQATAAASASSGHQFSVNDPAAITAIASALAGIYRTAASEKAADSAGDEPSSAVDAFLKPEKTDMGP